jgi:hypothetical protein
MEEPNPVLAAHQRLVKQALVDGALDAHQASYRRDLVDAVARYKEQGLDEPKAWGEALVSELMTLHSISADPIGHDAPDALHSV